MRGRSSLIRGTLSPGPPYTLARGDPGAPLRSLGSLASARSLFLRGLLLPRITRTTQIASSKGNFTRYDSPAIRPAESRVCRVSQIPPKERLFALTMRTLQMLGSVACAAKAAGKAPLERGVSFGSYRFEPGTGRLWADGREIRLTPKASAVLQELVSHAGNPVAKEDLFASVWSGTAVSDDALTSCVQELRKALEDDPRQPRFIETRHRRGYRFVAPLSPATGEDLHDSPPRTSDTFHHRRASVRRLESPPGPGVLLRGRCRGIDQRAHAHRWSSCRGPNLVLSVSAAPARTFGRSEGSSAWGPCSRAASARRATVYG